jgi:hydroxypyruvate isomerase
MASPRTAWFQLEAPRRNRFRLHPVLAYHAQINEGDVVRNLEKALPYLGHVHTAGIPGWHELDDRQEIDDRRICSLLAEAGDQGVRGQEFFARQPDKLRALQEASQVCNL